mgnify:CR=1 FL=1
MILAQLIISREKLSKLSQRLALTFKPLEKRVKIGYEDWLRVAIIFKL